MVKYLLQRLLPNICVLCHESSPAQAICNFCLAHLPWQSHCCICCAVPLANDALCGQCIAKPPAFDRVIAPFCYDFPLQHLIIQLKFSDKISYANVLGAVMLNTIREFYKSQEWPELLLPVPLSRQRIQQRGYNQALEIAKYVSEKLAIPLSRNSLIKIKDTPPQTELNFEARQRNVQKSFALNQAIHAKYVALLDDVVTTGSTVNEIAKLLKKNGVATVDVWSVARTAI